ncbi:MAG: hypothetical protein JXB39_10295 [Deltaproteobacteria bacterium]|nr:hypothetical protein [Deltaproteobacteria bacterium]
MKDDISVTSRRAYAMLVALVLMAILTVIGATTLSVAGVDHRIALYNRKHMMIVNTADAGAQHARDEMRWDYPTEEWRDSGDTGDWITATEAEARFGGAAYAHNLGVYRVRAIYQRCGNPPPGYSAEIGVSQYRSDYWRMESTATMENSSFEAINDTSATIVTTVRKVVAGACTM